MAKFYLHDIVNVDSTVIENEKWDKLYESMQRPAWAGSRGQRIGIVKPIFYSNMIAGSFANEGRKKAFWYDENKEEIEPEPFYSFERIFFVLFVDTAQLLIQSRNIYDYFDLGLPEIRNNLKNYLTDLFRLSGIYVPHRGIEMEDAGINYTYEELYSTFRELATVTEIEISGLFGGVFPEKGDPKYRLFNPKEEWEPITWGAVADTLKKGLDSVKMTTIEDPNSTLKAPIPKALAAVGKINKLKGYDAENHLVIRQHTETTEIDIPLSSDSEISRSALDHILEDLNSKGRVEIWENKKRNRIAGDLFGS